ncbi:hypothetical protein [Priestia megaterium]|uniref:hypothetical protein n=1 Tax=Priestia megaterium TaxID=1404 RepID=UPI001A95074F|nr:hypothetical protein [Priestia megaterium]QSX20027.1 hypothetical protein J0P05_22760 [Priestia megaterium]
MSESKNVKINAHDFALAVVQSVPVNGDSPESIVEQKFELYLAACEKVMAHNKTIIEVEDATRAEKMKQRVNNLLR